MKIAIACDEDESVKERLEDAELYRVYEIESGSIKSSELIRTINAGHNIIAQFLADKSVEALICGSADKHAKRIYARHGLVLYSENKGALKEIINNFLSGNFEY